MKSTAKLITGSAIVVAILFSGATNATERTNTRIENQSALTHSAPTTRELTRVLAPMPSKSPIPHKAPMPQKLPTPHKYPAPNKMPNPTKTPMPTK